MVGTSTIVGQVVLVAHSGRVLLAETTIVHAVLSHVHILYTLGHMALGADTWPQINNKAEHVEGVNEGDQPLEDGCDVLVMGEGCAGEDNGEDDLDEDEG